jgi:hypothetical protein
MTKRQFSLLLGLVGQAGCAVYDDALRREAFDAGTDVRGDGSFVARDAAVEGARPDAVRDAQASRDARPESSVGGDVATLEDAPDAVDPAEAGDAGGDASADAGRSDVLLDVAADTEGGAPDRGGDALVDAFGDPSIVACSVEFTVSGVTWEEDGRADGDGGAPGVRLVGDIAALGAWAPEGGRAMIEKAPGAWSASVVLFGETVVEFKFVKVYAAGAVEWEQWLPFDSNRSLRVACASDGGTFWIDAATEAGPAQRAVGRSYGGAFGVKPLDATK